MTDTRRLPVPDGLDGMRVDAGLSRLLGLSRTVVAALTEAGRVELDGRAAGKSDRLAAGSWLEVQLPEPDAPSRDQPGRHEVVAGLTVLHADDDIVVVDKPVGVAAHPSPGWTGPTVLGGLAALGYRVSTSGAAERQGIVHRLDVGTTGVMVVATSEHAYTVLKRAFKERTVDKRYHAVAQGHPDPSSGTIDAPIDRHPRHDYRFAVVAGGRPSVTHYDTVEAFRAASLLDIRLETGRTHQIRVHLSAVRHPLRRRPRPTVPTRRWPAGWACPAVAARPLAGLRAPGRRPLGGVHQPLPGRPGPRAAAAARLTRASARMTGRAAAGRGAAACAAGRAARRLVRRLAVPGAGRGAAGRLGPARPGPGRAGRRLPGPAAGRAARPRAPPSLALVQFGGERTPAEAVAPVAGTPPVTAVFRVPLPRVQTALRFEPLEPGVPPELALGTARQRAQQAAAADAGRLTGRPREVAAAEAAALAEPAGRDVLALVVRADRAGAGGAGRAPRRARRAGRPAGGDRARAGAVPAAARADRARRSAARRRPGPACVRATATPSRPLRDSPDRTRWGS